MKRVRFNDALCIAAKAVEGAKAESPKEVRLIRDVYGRISFVVNAMRDEFPSSASNFLLNACDNLGDFAASTSLLFREDFYDADAILKQDDWRQTLVECPGDLILTVNLLDRQITGQEWSSTTLSHATGSRPLRVVFFSVKGGVGRSTALTILALHLAKKGKRVLLMDFDLESPGLSSLLLPDDSAASFGLVDWFVETGVSEGHEGFPEDLVSYSPLNDQVEGSIRVASAAGRSEQHYLSKLSRVFADKSAINGHRPFAKRLIDLIELIEAAEEPDFVLIDSRGGIHDLAAVSIGSLADLALLFCTDSQQSWDGYRHLFKFWQQHPTVLRSVRERLKIVYGMFPETNQHERAIKFRRKSWDLFRDTLYDELLPGVESLNIDDFSFDEADDAAPHSPLKVRWNSRFAEFDPLVAVSEGGISDNDINFTYGEFLSGVDDLLASTTLVGPNRE